MRYLTVWLILSTWLILNSAPADWRYYGGDAGGSRYSQLDQIDRSNVHRLKKVWTYRTGEKERSPNISPDRDAPAFECTPIFAAGTLYISTPSNKVIALDAETGRELWQFDPMPGKAGYHQHRGVSYWEDAAKTGERSDARIIFGTWDGRLIALDARSGKPVAEFGRKGTADLRSGGAGKWSDALFAVTSPPAIFEDLAIVGLRLPESPGTGPSGFLGGLQAHRAKAVVRSGSFNPWGNIALVCSTDPFAWFSEGSGVTPLPAYLERRRRIQEKEVPKLEEE